ncbi:MAG: hypothetical protein WCL57_18770, partial [Chloroflexota bacterium]
PNTQTVYKIIEAIRKQRRRVAKRQSHVGVSHETNAVSQHWTQDELAHAVYFSYHDLAKGKLKAPPTRDILLKIGDYLQCDQYEMNRLLATANYAPVKRYLQGDDLASALNMTKQLMRYIRLPAYIMDHTWHIHVCNNALSCLFGLDPKLHHEINRAYPSQMVQLFKPGLPFYTLAASLGPENWRRCVIRDVIAFREDNLFTRNEQWFIEVMQVLNGFPEFATIWQALDCGQETMPSFDHYAPGAMVWYCQPQGVERMCGYWMHAPYSDVLNFPLVCVFVPADAHSAEQLRRLEISY